MYRNTPDETIINALEQINRLQLHYSRLSDRAAQLDRGVKLLKKTRKDKRDKVLLAELLNAQAVVQFVIDGINAGIAEYRAQIQKLTPAPGKNKPPHTMPASYHLVRTIVTPEGISYLWKREGEKLQ